MGCLKKIINILILALAIIGFISIGGKEWVTSLIQNYLNPSKESILERASKLGNFSGISDEFEIDRAASAFGYSGVLAEHNSTGQKLLIVDSGKKPLLTKEDFESDNMEQKLVDMAKKYTYKSVSVENIEVTKKGIMHAYGKDAPYVRFNAQIKKLPIGDISGIISCVDLNDDDSRLLIAINEKDKYSQLITDEFFKKIKP